MIYWLFAFLSFATFISSLIVGKRNDWVFISSMISVVLSILGTILFTALAILLPVKTEEKVASMQNNKAIIENFYKSENKYLQCNANNMYWEYEFSLAQMKDSKNSFGMFSKYYNVNLELLELNLED